MIPVPVKHLPRSSYPLGVEDCTDIPFIEDESRQTTSEYFRSRRNRTRQTACATSFDFGRALLGHRSWRYCRRTRAAFYLLTRLCSTFRSRDKPPSCHRRGIVGQQSRVQSADVARQRPIRPEGRARGQRLAERLRGAGCRGPLQDGQKSQRKGPEVLPENSLQHGTGPSVEKRQRHRRAQNVRLQRQVETRTRRHDIITGTCRLS